MANGKLTFHILTSVHPERVNTEFDFVVRSITPQDLIFVDYLGRGPVADAAPELVEAALRKAGAGSDNVTVVALEWETPDAEESGYGVSTDSISDGVFASTIQAGVPDGLHDDLDDAAIERSIAEINDAIRRSAARRL